MLRADGQERGGFDPGVPGAEIAHIRRAEQQAAKLPGVSEVKFSGLGSRACWMIGASCMRTSSA